MSLCHHPSKVGDLVVAGDLEIGGGHSTYFQTGNAIMESPLYSRVLMTHTLHRIISGKRNGKRDRNKVDAIPLTLYDTNHMDTATKLRGPTVECVDAMIS